MNRILTLEEVLALPDGARVWVEGHFEHRFDGVYFRAKKDGSENVLRDVNNPDSGCWLMPQYVGTYIRVWSLPQPPTAEERAATPWMEET